MHILPKGFTRIRHYGFLSSSKKKQHLPLLKTQLGTPVFSNEKEPTLHRKCPSCKKGELVTVAVFDSRGPPKNWKEKLEKQYKVTPKSNG